MIFLLFLGATKYTISVVTSDIENAGTNGSMYLTLLGSTGKADPVLEGTSNNNGKSFQRGQ